MGGWERGEGGGERAEEVLTAKKLSNTRFKTAMSRFCCLSGVSVGSCGHN